MLKKTVIMTAGVIAVLLVSLVAAGGESDAEPQELFGVEGLGTESSPYLVDSADDLSTINQLSTSMRNGTSINVELASDIDITDAEYDRTTGSFINYFRGTFDGNGYAITGTNHSVSFILQITFDSTVVKDLTIDIGSTTELIFYCNGELLMSDITVEGWGTGSYDGTNNSPFISHAFGDITMERCVNNASLILGNYGAVFLGGYVNNGHSATFIDCVNNGNVMGQNPSLFIGNPWRTDITTLTISGCANYGQIIGTEWAEFIAALSGTSYGNNFVKLNNVCKNDPGVVSTGSCTDWVNDNNIFSLDSYIIEGIAGNDPILNSSLTITMDTSHTVTSDVGSYVEYTIGAMATGVGTWMTTIDIQQASLQDGKASFTGNLGGMMTYALADTVYGVSSMEAVTSGTTNNGFPWSLYNIDGIYLYAVDFGDTEFTLNATSVTLGANVYDGNGMPVGYASQNLTQTLPTATTPSSDYYKVFVYDESYVTIDLESRFVLKGSSITFSLVAMDGYSLADNLVVTAFTTYNTNDKTRAPLIVSDNQDGTYTISNIQTNVYIYVDGGEDETGEAVDPFVPITHSVSYSLSNSMSTTSISSVSDDGSFATTITPENGFFISGVTVLMDGVRLSGVYDSETGQILIPSVTGDLEIIVTSMPLSAWDDDDYVPQPPIQEVVDNSEDDTVTIVACAAAAVVAAILAVFLIVERKH